jgi:general secretion pathway protein F
MAVFEYQGLDAMGKQIAGIIDADSPKQARGRLRQQGVFPTDVSEQTGGAVKGSGLNVEIDVAQWLSWVSSKDISILTKQMAVLLSAAVPMHDTLNALVDQTEKQKLKVVLSKVKEKVNQGSSLADALGEHPKIFSDLYVQMVRAGESAGALDAVLVRLSKFLDSQVKLQGQVISALAYPILMSFVGVAILMGLFLGVIPRIRQMFESMGGSDSLPLITKGVFLFGDMLVMFWWMPPPLSVVLYFAHRYWVATESGRRKWDQFRLRIPIFGKVNRLVAVTRFCRTFGTLLASGVPIIRSLDIVKSVVGNVIIEAAIDDARVNIQEGQSVAGPLKASGQFPPMVTHMIAIGEKTGDLEPMLDTVANAYEDEVETTMTALTSILGPLVIVVLGGVVFICAVGLLLPMLNLSSMIK